MIWRRALALLVACFVTTGAGFGVVGDSVAWDAKDELRARGATVRAYGGVDIVAGRPAIRAFVREGRRRLVVELGLMDVGYGQPAHELRRRIRAVMRDDLARVRCPLWVDLRERSPRYPSWPERAKQFNRILREEADRYGVHVIRWSVFSRDRREWFRRDGFHPRGVGQRAFARFVDLQVDRFC